jgi:hypothetical protein
MRLYNCLYIFSSSHASLYHLNVETHCLRLSTAASAMSGFTKHKAPSRMYKFVNIWYK